MNTLPMKMSEILAEDGWNSKAFNETENVVHRKHIDIVCFPIIEWDFRHQRTQHLLARLARKGHRVFHLTSSLRPLKEDFMVKKLIDNVFELHLNSPHTINIYKDTFDEEILKSLLQSINSVAKQLDIDAMSWVVFPTWTHLVLKLREMYGWKIIYDCLDAHTGFSDVEKIRAEEERLLIKESDLVTTSSLLLYKNAQEIKNDRTLLIHNACEFQHFSVLPPNSMIRVKKPIIGYIGAIRDWLDTELIELIATRKKDCNIVLIGNVGDGNNAGIERLRKLSNVHFLGEKIYHDLPKFIYHFDVCLIPFRKTPLIDATNPVKFYEYLASGKPVVSTTMNDLLPYAKLCYLAEDHQDFLKKVEIALNEKDQQLVKDRIDFAKQNTWKNRMDVLYPYIESLNKFGTLSSVLEPSNPNTL